MSSVPLLPCFAAPILAASEKMSSDVIRVRFGSVGGSLVETVRFPIIGTDVAVMVGAINTLSISFCGSLVDIVLVPMIDSDVTISLVPVTSLVDKVRFTEIDSDIVVSVHTGSTTGSTKQWIITGSTSSSDLRSSIAKTTCMLDTCISSLVGVYVNSWAEVYQQSR